MDCIYGLGLPGMFLSCCFPLARDQGGEEVAPTFGWESFASECTFSIGRCHLQPREFPPGDLEGVLVHVNII